MAKGQDIATIEMIDEQSMKDCILLIRGQYVMLDSDLAAIYGYSTKDFNRQVKNNIDKFDEEDFMFQLTENESRMILRCKISTAKTDSRLNNSTLIENRGGRRYLPYAFTESGIYMLMTVLRGEMATKQSKALIRTFRKMKDYIVENQAVLGQREYLQLSLQTSENVHRYLRQFEVDDMCRQYPQLKFEFKESGGKFHDRYVVIDYNTSNEKIYHCGASSKDGGNKVTTITLLTEASIYHPLFDQVLRNNPLVLS